MSAKPFPCRLILLATLILLTPLVHQASTYALVGTWVKAIPGDMPGGNTVQIKKSLAKIKKMDRQLIIYPGHGQSSSLEYELESNYYLEECFLREGTKKEKGDLL